MKARIALAVVAALVSASVADAGPGLLHRLVGRAAPRQAPPAVYRAAAAQTYPAAYPVSYPAAAPAAATVPSAAEAGAVDALDEVNAARARRGLPPFQRDPLLSQAAAGCAAYRARALLFGHVTGGMGDFGFLRGGHAAATGCAAYQPSYGWMSCCTYDNYRYAGAAWVMGRDGRRFMSLFVR